MRAFPAVLAAVLFGCAPAEEADGEGLGEGELSSARVIEEGTPEAAGVLAMLSHRSTTLVVLDDDAALNKTAATNLIAHRDGKDARFGTSDDDLYDTIAEVDAVAYVGDAALSALLTYATDAGWIPTGDEYYGTIETVSFTVTEADAVVALANTATVELLDVDVALDSRAAAGIVAKRPFTTVEQVASVSYVGAAALTNLKAYAKAHPSTSAALGTDEAVAELTTAVSGLWFMSEGDYALTPFRVDSPATTTLTADNVKAAIGSAYVARDDRPTLAERTVEASSLGWVFDRYTVEQDWWDEWYLEEAPKWRAVRDIFENDLDHVTVWRFGRKDSFGTLTGDIDVFVVGVSAEGDLVGVWTVSIET